MDCCPEIICQQYNRFIKRLEQLQPKRHRRQLTFLSRPKYIRRKIVRQTSRYYEVKRKTQIIREERQSTRIEQLAYPRVRKILPTREAFKCILSEERLKLLDETMKKSLFSLYSRLSNCQPPPQKKRVKKWSNREWEVHRKHLLKLANPKKIFRPPQPISKYMDISIMSRFLYLCKPKVRMEHFVPEWKLTPGLKLYRASQRLLALAKPKEYSEEHVDQTLPIKISPAALQYKASDRIKELATNAEVRLGETDLKENPFGVVPNALKAKASDRVVELAQPKEFEEGPIRKNAFTISPAALKAKATPRLIELAQPKSRPS